MSKCRLVMAFTDPEDGMISGAGIQIRTKRKWSATNTVSHAESILDLKDIVGNSFVVRQGLETTHFQQFHYYITSGRTQQPKKNES